MHTQADSLVPDGSESHWHRAGDSLAQWARRAPVTDSEFTVASFQVNLKLASETMSPEPEARRAGPAGAAARTQRVVSAS